MHNLTIEQTPVHALKPRDRNARTHSKRQIRQIANSIREFGFNNPVLTDDSGSIIAGHGRVEAAKLLELPTVPTVRLSHLNETQRGNVNAIRKEIAACYGNIKVIEHAPPVPADMKHVVRAYVDDLAAQAKPKMTNWGRSVEPRFGEPSPGSSIPPGNRPPDLFAFLCWYDRDAMVAKLQAEVEAQRDPNSLPEPERNKRIRHIRSCILALEREEEWVIMRKASQGILIPRRSDASPLAILGTKLLARARENAAA